MDFKEYNQKRLADLPPNLEDGQKLGSITKVTEQQVTINGKPAISLRVFADGKEFRTTSEVLRATLTDFFANNKGATLDNVQVVQPKGKRYLTLQPA